MTSDPCDRCNVGTYSNQCQHFCAAHRRAVERDTQRGLAEYKSKRHSEANSPQASEQQMNLDKSIKKE